jgi:hypothetical protein
MGGANICLTVCGSGITLTAAAPAIAVGFAIVILSSAAGYAICKWTNRY